MKNVEENKKELKKKIDDIKGLIKANSKDAHYADTLISELLSLHKELKHEPTLVNIPMSDVEKSHEGDGWEMCYTKRGEAVYKTTGGYTLICGSIFSALNSTIESTIDYFNKNIGVELNEEEKEIFEDDIVKNMWLFNLPLHACSDLEFKKKLVEMFIEWIEKQLNMSSEDTQEETIEQDEMFKQAMIGIDEVKEIVGDEVEKLKEK